MRLFAALILIFIAFSVQAVLGQAPPLPPPDFLQEEKAWIKEDGAPRETWGQYNDTVERILNLTYRHSAVNIAYVIRSSDPGDVIRATFIVYRNASSTNGFNSTGHLYPGSVPAWTQLLLVSTNQTEGEYTYHLFIATFDPEGVPGVYQVRINLSGTLSGGSSWQSPNGNPRVPWMFFRVPEGTSWPVSVSDQLGRYSPFFLDTPIPSTEFNASMVVRPPGNDTGVSTASVWWNSTNGSTIVFAQVPVYYAGQGRWAAQHVVPANASLFPANYTSPYRVTIQIGPYRRHASFYVYPLSAAIAPDTWLVETPPAISENRTAVFRWTGSDLDGQVVLYHYRLDSAEWITTTETRTVFYGLSNGTHRFEVRSRDDDGIDDPTPAWFSFVVRVNSPPDTWISSGPNATSTEHDVSFSWGGSDIDGLVVSYQYRMDGSSWRNTTETTMSYRNLSSGNHTFQVRAVDDKGAVDPTPASWSFEIMPTWCERELARLRQLVEELEERIQALTEQNENLTETIAQLEEINSELSERVQLLEQEKEDLLDRIGELERQRTALLARIENLTRERDDLELRLQDCEEETCRLTEEKRMLESRILDLNQTLSLCQREVERLQLAESNLLGLVKDLRETISRLRSELPEFPVYFSLLAVPVCASLGIGFPSRRRRAPTSTGSTAPRDML